MRDLAEVTGGKRQLAQVARSEHDTVEGLRKDSAIVRFEYRQDGNVRADLQLGLGNPHLAGQAQVRELVCGASIVMGRQQAGIDPVRG
ncbi:hypothetical protein D3C85_932910 [compost metagenome]